MNPMWAIAACVGWSASGILVLVQRCDLRRALAREIAMADQLQAEVAARGALVHQVDGLNTELADARRDRDAAQGETVAKAGQLADQVAANREMRDRSEVAIAQAARWCSERDVLRGELEAAASLLNSHGEVIDALTDDQAALSAVLLTLPIRDPATRLFRKRTQADLDAAMRRVSLTDIVAAREAGVGREAAVEDHGQFIRLTRGEG